MPDNNILYKSKIQINGGTIIAFKDASLNTEFNNFVQNLSGDTIKIDNTTSTTIAQWLNEHDEVIAYALNDLNTRIGDGLTVSEQLDDLKEEIQGGASNLYVKHTDVIIPNNTTELIHGEDIILGTIGASVIKVHVSSDNDFNVKQNLTTEAGDIPIILKTNTSTTDYPTNTVKYASDLKYNPGTKVLSVPTVTITNATINNLKATSVDINTETVGTSTITTGNIITGNITTGKITNASVTSLTATNSLLKIATVGTAYISTTIATSITSTKIDTTELKVGNIITNISNSPDEIGNNALLTASAIDRKINNRLTSSVNLKGTISFENLLATTGATGDLWLVAATDSSGDVYEFIWTGTKWEQLGKEQSFVPISGVSVKSPIPVATYGATIILGTVVDKTFQFKMIGTPTDEKVKQISLTSAGDYPIILKTNTNTSDSPTNTVNYNADLKYNPGTKVLSVPTAVITNATINNLKATTANINTETVGTSTITTGNINTGKITNASVTSASINSLSATNSNISIATIGTGYIPTLIASTIYATSIPGYVKEEDLKLSSGYTKSASSNTDLNLKPNDTYENAFGKIHKAILDNEEAIAAALVNLNDRIGDGLTVAEQIEDAISTNNNNYLPVSSVDIPVSVPNGVHGAEVILGTIGATAIKLHLPEDNDTKVTQTVITASGDYPIILKTNTNTSDSPTNTVNYNSELKYNPGTKVLSVPTAVITNATVNNLKATSVNINTETVGTSTITTGNISTGKITNASVNSLTVTTFGATTLKVINASITSASVNNLTATTLGATTGNITTANINTETVGTSTITTGNISTGKITNASVNNLTVTTFGATTLKATNASITSASVNNLTATTLGATTGNITTANITTGNISTGKITNASVNNLTVTTFGATTLKAINASITSASINNLTATTLGATTGNITTANINTSKITNASVTSASINSLSATNSNISIATIGTGYIPTLIASTIYATSIPGYVKEEDLKLSSGYTKSASSNTDLNLKPNDTYENAFSKIHKAIIDNEEITAAALNDLNDRIGDGLTVAEQIEDAISTNNNSYLPVSSIIIPSATPIGSHGSDIILGTIGATSIKFTFPSDLDAKVTQTAITTSGDYPIILKTNTNTSDSPTNTVNYNADLKYNPGTKVLSVPTAVITNATINNLKATSVNINTETVGTSTITTGNIATGKITNASVNNLTVTTFGATTLKATNASITSASINNLTATTLGATTGNITTANITTGNINTGKITNASVNSLTVTTFGVTTLKATNASITSASINNLTATTLGATTGNITTANINTGKITNASVNSLTVTTFGVTILKATNASITSASVNNLTVTTIAATNAKFSYATTGAEWITTGNIGILNAGTITATGTISVPNLSVSNKATVISAKINDIIFDNATGNILTVTTIYATSIPGFVKESQLYLPEEYSMSTAVNEDLEPLPLDSFATAISKLHKALLDDELIISAAYNNLEDRKVNYTSIANVALSGDYNDLINTPTSLSYFFNDLGDSLNETYVLKENVNVHIANGEFDSTAILGTIDGNVIGIYIPPTVTEDKKVKQTYVYNNENYPIILKKTSGTSDITDEVNYNADLKYNPSSMTLSVPTGIITNLKVTNASVTSLTATSSRFSIATSGTNWVTTENVNTLNATNAKITTGTITNTWVNSITGTNSKFTTGTVGTNWVTTENVNTLNATNAKIGTGTVTTTWVNSITGTNAKFTTGTITNAWVNSITGTNSKFTTGTVGTNWVTTENVNTLNATNAKFTTGTVGTNWVTTENINTLNATNAKIGTGTVTTTWVNSITGTNSKFTTGTVGTNWVTTENVNTLNATTAKIGTGTVTTTWVNSITGTNSKFTTGTVGTNWVTTENINTLNATTATITNIKGTNVTISVATIGNITVTSIASVNNFKSNIATVSSGYISTGIIQTINSSVINASSIPGYVKEEDLKLSSVYTMSASVNADLILNPLDSYETAFGKLHKAIADDEEVVAAALVDINNRISVMSATGILLSEDYSIATTSGTALEPVAEDSLQDAISKLHKAVLDIEYVVAAAINDINARLNKLNI